MSASLCEIAWNSPIGAPELLAGLGVVERVVEGRGCRAGARRREAQPLVPEIGSPPLPSRDRPCRARPRPAPSRRCRTPAWCRWRAGRASLILRDLDARQFRVHQEIGDALLLFLSGGGARDQQAVVADVHARGEHLLPVDDIAAVGRASRAWSAPRRRSRIAARSGRGRTRARRARRWAAASRFCSRRAVLHHRVAAVGERAEQPHRRALRNAGPPPPAGSRDRSPSRRCRRTRPAGSGRTSRAWRAHRTLRAAGAPRCRSARRTRAGRPRRAAPARAPRSVSCSGVNEKSMRSPLRSRLRQLQHALRALVHGVIDELAVDGDGGRRAGLFHRLELAHHACR